VGSSFHTTCCRVIFAMVVARRIMLKLVALVMMVDGGEKNLIDLNLKIIIKQATSLLVFSI
jgi:hypothetical protein